MSYSLQLLTVNVNTRRIVRDAASLLEIAYDDQPRFYVDETTVLGMSFVDKDGAAIVFDAGDTFELAIDDGLSVRATNNVMAYSDNAMFDIAGQWADIDRATGKISVQVDCDRALFASRTDDADGDNNAWLQIRLIPNGETAGSTICLDRCRCIDAVIGPTIPLP
jgi:hypothetical protein